MVPSAKRCPGSSSIICMKDLMISSSKNFRSKIIIIVAEHRRPNKNRGESIFQRLLLIERASQDGRKVVILCHTPRRPRPKCSSSHPQNEPSSRLTMTRTDRHHLTNNNSELLKSSATNPISHCPRCLAMIVRASTVAAPAFSSQRRGQEELESSNRTNLKM